MLRIKRKRDEEPVPLLFITKSSTCPESLDSFKRRKQTHDCVFMLSETLQSDSITTDMQKLHGKQTIEAEKHPQSSFVYTLKQMSTTEKVESTHDEIAILNEEKSLKSPKLTVQSFQEENYVYDMYVPLIYTPETFQTVPLCFGVLRVEEDENISFLEETLSSHDDNDDEDSNAEDFYQNSYPDEDEWTNSDIEQQRDIENFTINSDTYDDDDSTSFSPF